MFEDVHADTYSDYLEMAEGLLGTGRKDAAAVIAGVSIISVCEQSIRKVRAGGIEFGGISFQRTGLDHSGNVHGDGLTVLGTHSSWIGSSRHPWPDQTRMTPLCDPARDIRNGECMLIRASVHRVHAIVTGRI